MKNILTTILALALSTGLWAQNRDTMFIHQGENSTEFLIKDVDSIIFQRIPGVAVPVAVSGVQLNYSYALLEVDQTIQLSETVLPPNAVNKKTAWISSNPDIVTVSQSGEVKAIAIGKASVFVVTHDGDFAAESVVEVLVEVIPVTAITLNETQVNLWPRGTVALTATIEPDEATNKNVSWVSDRPEVASVSHEGLVTGIVPGQARITVTTQNGGLTANCDITVANVAVESISLDITSSRLLRGQQLPLVAKTNPEHATNQNMTWSSSDETVATVDQNGVVTALQKIGTTKITVTTEEGEFQAFCDISVVEGPNINTIATYVQEPWVKTIDDFKAKEISSTYYLTQMSPKFEELLANYTTNARPEFTYIDAITSSIPNGRKFRLMFHYSTSYWWAHEQEGADPVTGKEGLIPMATPNNPNSDLTIEIPAFTQRNLGNLFSASGYAGEPGGALITEFRNLVQASTGWTLIQDGENFWFRSKADPNDWLLFIRQFTNYSVTNITLDKSVDTMSFESGIPTMRLKSTIEPFNSAYKMVVWSSSDETVATVDHYGLVTGVAPGDVRITATSKNGGYTAYCNVHIKASSNPVTGIKISDDTKGIAFNESCKLTAAVEPNNAINQSIRGWRSSNKWVASVDQDGNVIGVGEGTALIIVTSEEGSFEDTCEVTVGASGLNWKTIATFEQNPDVASTETFVQGRTKDNPYVYHITQHSPRFQQGRQQYLNEFPTFTNVWYIKAPRDEYQLNFVVDWPTGAGGRRGPNASTDAMTVLTGEGANPLCDVSFVNLNSNTTLANLAGLNTNSGTPDNRPSGYLNPTTGIYKLYDYLSKTTATTGWTIIQDGSTFWFRSKADSSEWFAASLRDNEISSYPNIAGIEIQEESIVLEGTGSKSITAHVMPVNALNVLADRNLTWASTDETVVTVQNGIVTAVAPGTAKIAVTTANALFSDTIEVEVKAVLVESVKLDTNKYDLLVGGDPLTLEATVLPSVASNKNVVWSSSADAVATVADGVVTAVSGGDAIIYAKSEENAEIYDSCIVTVEVPAAAVTGVSLNLKKAALKVGTPFTLDATVEPNNAGNKNVTWRSGDGNIATVDATTGAINFLTTGDVKIIVKTDEGDFEDTCEVSVVAAFSEDLLPVWVQAPETKTLEAFKNGGTPTDYIIDLTKSTYFAQLFTDYVTLQTNFDNRLTFMSNSNGNFKFRMSFYYNNTANSYWFHDPTSASAEGLVPMTGNDDNPLCDITIDNSLFGQRSSLPFSASGWATDAAHPGKDIMKQIRNFFGASTGFTMIQDGINFYFRSKADQNKWFKAEGIAVNAFTLQASLEITIGGEDVTLEASVTPANAYYKKATWSSDNEGVATVDATTGKVHAVSVGTANITAVIGDGKSKVCAVTVISPVAVDGVSLPETETAVLGMPVVKLNATVSPSNAFNKNVSWESTNTDVVTIDATSGAMTFLTEGNTKIVVKTEDGNFTDTCVLTVSADDPEDDLVAALFNGFPSSQYYDMVDMSSKIQGWYNSYKEAFPTFTSLSLRIPYNTTYQAAWYVTFYNGSATGTYLRRPSSNSEDKDENGRIRGVVPMTGESNNAKRDVTFATSSNSYLTAGEEALPTGYNGSSTGIVQFFTATQVSTGWTIVQNDTTFYFISKADPNDWFALKRR